MHPVTYCFLHGFMGSPTSFGPVARHLDPRHRVLSITLPGHGPRPRPTASWQPTLRDLDRHLDDEGIDRCHLVGYSMGGRIALAWADLRPDRFTHVSLISAHPPLDTEAARVARQSDDAAVIARLRREGLEAFVAWWETRPLFASQRTLDPELLAAQRATRRSHTVEGLVSALEHLGLGSMAPIDLAPRPASVRWMVGAEDLSLRARLEALGIAARVVDRIGHNVLLERPDVVAAWLEEGERACTSP